MTSVVLVVASTFNEAMKRGEVPPGLRAPRAGVPSVSGAFAIDGVPDGTYVVLAAFENDSLVRDPDTSIGGTQIQRVQIGDGNRQVALSAGFKITEALAVMRPGAGEAPEVMTSGAVSFSWKDDSSEDRYTLEVIDARGNVVWNVGVPKQTGGDVVVPYNGPALQAGRPVPVPGHVVPPGRAHLADRGPARRVPDAVTGQYSWAGLRLRAGGFGRRSS